MTSVRPHIAALTPVATRRRRRIRHAAGAAGSPARAHPKTPVAAGRKKTHRPSPMDLAKLTITPIGPPPVAAAPVAAAPVSAPTTAVQAPQAATPASPSTGAAASAAPATAAAAPIPAIDLEKGLAALKQQFSEDYDGPITAADGNVYMVARKPEVADGKVFLRYVLAGKADAATSKLTVNQAFLDSAGQSQAPPADRKLAKIGDSYAWEVISKGPDGKLTATVQPLTDAELQALDTKQRQDAAQTALQEKQDWASKLGYMAFMFRTLGIAGNTATAMMAGPDPYTGKPKVGWASGLITLQMLDGWSGGHLLPQWMKRGVAGTVLDYGSTAYYLLTMGDDLKVLGQAFPRAASVMRAFTSPTRAAIHGASQLVDSIAGKAPAAGVGPTAGAAVAGAAQSAAAAAQDATHASLVSLGAGLRDGSVGLVGGSRVAGLADQAAIVTQEGLKLVPKSVVQAAERAATPALAGGAKIAAKVDGAIGGSLKVLMPALRYVNIFGNLFQAVSGAMQVQQVVKTQGVSALATDNRGRGALLGFLSGSAFLGMMLLGTAPLWGALGAAAPVVSSALSVASNVLMVASTVNGAGLLGGGGLMDHDAVRAAFLIPPLTPLGILGFAFKHREKKKAAQAKALEDKKQAATAAVQQVRAQAASQLASAGAVAGQQQLKDGSLLVPTGVNEDLTQAPVAAAAPQPNGLAQTMQTLSRAIPSAHH